MGLIQNYRELATGPAREDVLSVIEAGLQSIQPEAVMWDRFLLKGSKLTIKGDKTYETDINDYDSVSLLGIGKGSAGISKHIARRLRTKLTRGYVIDSVEQDAEDNGRYPNMTFRHGDHPIPTKHNQSATREAVDCLKTMDYSKNTSGKELTLAVICGGASSMFTDPYIGMKKFAALTKDLLKHGANIYELNTVRKHLDGVKGGNLAKRLYREGRNIVSLMFSDVPTADNPKSFIASGPTELDQTTNDDSMKIMSKYGIEGATRTMFSETPKEEIYFQNVHNIILLDNKTPLEAMKNRAEKLGYKVGIFATDVGGEARSVSEKIIRKLYGGDCNMIIAGGETIVKVGNKDGAGGRNREVVLGSLAHMVPDTVAASIGTDGWDYMDYAGALADQETVYRSAALKLDPREHLDLNISQKFFDSTGGNIRTGRLPSNVADLMVFARKKSG